MNMNSELEGDVVVVGLTGDFVARTVEQFKALMTDLLEKKKFFVVLELSGVTFMDSSGLGACMATHRAFQEKSGVLVFAKPSAAVAKIFRVTRADQKLRVVPTRQGAVRSVQDLVAGRPS